MGERVEPRAPKVLVVDGGPEAPLQAPFAGQGYDVRVVEAGDARLAMDEFAPDVLVIDLRHADPVLTVRHVARRDDAERAAHLRALLEELGAAGTVVRVDDLEVDLQRQLARFDGRQVALTSTELVLLVVLARAGGIVPKHELLATVWGSPAANPNNLEVHISSLRRKLSRLGPELIRTVRGVGYGLGVVHATSGVARAE
jgi:DNA-binding response OmpR family regulator